MPGEEAGFFKVQVGHQQRLFARPEERAALRQHEFVSAKGECERNGNHAAFTCRAAARFGKSCAHDDWTPQTAQARDWFETLRDRICAEFEAIEREAGSDAAFEYTPWDRETDDGADGGGGVRGVMKGKVFEKVGVNVSTVSGEFAPQFAATINGASEEQPGVSRPPASAWSRTWPTRMCPPCT